jgi:predicted hydrolase (HD superfamily)
MGIELLIVVLVAAGLAFWYFNKNAKTTDLNSDGKTDVKDALVAVENTVAGVKAAADVNKDGKVDAGDVKVVATKAKAGAKKAATGVRKQQLRSKHLLLKSQKHQK